MARRRLVPIFGNALPFFSKRSFTQNEYRTLVDPCVGFDAAVLADKSVILAGSAVNSCGTCVTFVRLLTGVPWRTVPAIVAVMHTEHMETPFTFAEAGPLPLAGQAGIAAACHESVSIL
jgi:hypothetical protein